MMGMKMAINRHAVCMRPCPGFERRARIIAHIPWFQKFLQRFVPRYVVWEDDSTNLVTTAGKNKVLDAALKGGLTTPAWYIGLVDNASWGAGYAAGDILSSHAGWIEAAQYTGNRKAWTPGTISAGSVDNVGSTAVFAMNNTVTVRGCFMCDAASGTSGTLLGEGDFSSSRALISGDTLSVTATVTV